MIKMLDVIQSPVNQQSNEPTARMPKPDPVSNLVSNSWRVGEADDDNQQDLELDVVQSPVSQQSNGPTTRMPQQDPVSHHVSNNWIFGGADDNQPTRFRVGLRTISCESADQRTNDKDATTRLSFSSCIEQLESR